MKICEIPKVQYWDGATSADKGEAFPGGLLVQGKGKSSDIKVSETNNIVQSGDLPLSPHHQKKDATY